MTLADAITEPAVSIHADHTVVKRFGHWTTAGRFQVRARYATVVLDLRSPRIAGPLTLALDVDHGLVRLLLPEDLTVAQEDLRWTGRGRVKDATAPTGDSGRGLRLTGHVHTGEIRVHRGGVAVLSAMCSRAYLDDLRRAHREGRMPTVDDPARTA